MSRPKGFKHTKETKQRMSFAQKGEKNSQYGKPLSEETKRKISLKKLGNKCLLGFKHSEKSKKEMSESRKGLLVGNKNPRWKGGKIKTLKGYIIIHQPNHPFCSNAKYVLEHRLIMEKHLGRYIQPIEIVHHINNIHNDNRVENLFLVKNNSEHARIHNKYRTRKNGKFISE